MFKVGWDTVTYLGADTHDWEKADKEILADWGFKWGTWAANACGPLNSKRHCHVPQQVLLANSTETTTPDDEGCKITNLGKFEWRNNHTAVSVDVLCGTPASPAPWTLTFKTLGYVQDGAKDDPVVSYPVFASTPTGIIVPEPMDTSSTLAFFPFVGKPKSNISLGDDIPPNFKALTLSHVGSDVIYPYAFQYLPQ
jgi:hypothetical protein